jgi:hypothetical protein
LRAVLFNFTCKYNIFCFSQQCHLFVPVGVVVGEKTTLQHLVRAERQKKYSGILYAAVF